MTKARLLVVVAFAVGVSCLYAAEKNVTLEGTLVSSACYLENDSHPTGNDMGRRKACGTECLKRGDPGLVTKEKEFHILVAPSLAFAPYVGQQVRVTGNDHNGTIAVEKAEVSKDGNWEEINKSKMWRRLTSLALSL